VFDPAKNERNTRVRGLSFAAANDFDFSAAIVDENTRRLYPERRFEALGPLNGRIHMLVFTPVRGGIRVISFRKANKREVKQYEEATKP